MIARLRRRPLYALTALLGFLAGGTSKAWGWDPCPHHDTVPAPAAGQTEAQSSGHAHVQAAPSTDVTAASDHGEDHGACSCLGHCDASINPAVAPRSSVVSLGLVQPAAVAVPAFAEPIVYRPGGLWLLHFATAPPATV